MTISRLMLFCLSALLAGVSGAQASIYDFSYVGVGDPGVYGSGTFTTGVSLGGGYFAITSITGTTEAGQITGLEVSGGQSIAPPAYLYCCSFYYDNAFSPTGLTDGNPFSSTGGLLFDVANAPLSPVNLFGGGNGDTYEFSWGEDSLGGPPSYGGTQIVFTAVDPVPEPSLYGCLAFGMGGLLYAIRHARVGQRIGAEIRAVAKA